MPMREALRLPTLELPLMKPYRQDSSEDSLESHLIASESPVDDEHFQAFMLRQKRTRIHRLARPVVSLFKGPREPRDDPPKPFSTLMSLESLPQQLATTIPTVFRISAFAIYLLLWVILFHAIVLTYWLTPPQFAPDQTLPVIPLGCSDAHGWTGKNAACGMNGVDCALPAADSDVIVRCPALCDKESVVYSFVPIGDQKIKYRGYYVGGGPVNDESRLHPQQITAPYRADSSVCGAAVHAGIVSPFTGGAARISFDVPQQFSFPSALGNYGVSPSVEFQSFFPRAFYFKEIGGHATLARDPRLFVVSLNILLGIPVVYFASAAAVYWTMNIVGFWTISLTLDPPITPSHVDGRFSALISMVLARLLPSCFILYVLWHCSAKRTLTLPKVDSVYLQSPLKRLLYWYPLLWLGILNNLTFDRLPVDRLTLDDIRLQAQAAFCLLILIPSVVICGVIQARQIWLSGRFAHYAKIYAMFAMGLILINQIPDLTLRVHHYILAMILIPGCATRGTTALLFQGVLGGLFLAGTARWGLDSIAETSSSLKRNDPQGMLPPPNFAFDSTTWDLLLSNVTSNVTGKLRSVSLLINDVERFVSAETEPINLKRILMENKALSASIEHSIPSNSSTSEILLYLRMGWKLAKGYSDFSQAAIVNWPSGEFTPPSPGLT